MSEHIYLAIDLKSFYASVECVERGLDPLNTNLVVADKTRTDKTICLAVSPSLKSYGISGRARLFEVVQRMKEVNSSRKAKAPDKSFRSSSYFFDELKKDASLEADYITAPPRMSLYMKYSTDIYRIYLKYVAPEDIHVYSIDEVFMDITSYLKLYRTTPYGLARRIIGDVLEHTGITATAGIGTNLYLCKVAMDIVAKHIPADKDGVRIAELDERRYRTTLWNHRPLTDFWRIGSGYARKLEPLGLMTMGDIARFSLKNEGYLYKLFGINAELLIDHAWGWEPCTISDIRAYRPYKNSISSGQVLECPCDHERTRLLVWEMADMLALELVEKKAVTNQLVLTIGYDKDNLNVPSGISYRGKVTSDHYGRRVPKHAHGTSSLDEYTDSSKKITNAIMQLYERIIDKKLLTRRINITAGNIINKADVKNTAACEQLSFFSEMPSDNSDTDTEKEMNIQRTMIEIKHRFGKNAILKGTNYTKGAATISRNKKIGGHSA